MRSKLRTLIAVIAISVSLIFGGCSGGGGGGGGDGGGGSSQISYTGNTAPALVTDTNAQDLAVEAFLGGEVATDLGVFLWADLTV